MTCNDQWKQYVSARAIHQPVPSTEVFQGRKWFPARLDRLCALGPRAGNRCCLPCGVIARLRCGWFSRTCDLWFTYTHILTWLSLYICIYVCVCIFRYRYVHACIVSIQLYIYISVSSSLSHGPIHYHQIGGVWWIISGSPCITLLIIFHHGQTWFICGCYITMNFIIWINHNWCIESAVGSNSESHWTKTSSSVYEIVCSHGWHPLVIVPSPSICFGDGFGVSKLVNSL